MINNIFQIARSGVFKRTIVYTSSSSLNALVTFLLLPVLTRYLSPFDYGVVETFMAVVACLTGVVLMGGNTLMSRDYFVLREDDRREYAGEILGMILIMTALLILIYLFSIIRGDFWAHILKINRMLIILAIVVSAGSAFIAMVSNTFQLEKKPISFAVFMNSKTFLEISLSLLLIIWFGLSWAGKVTGFSTSILIFCFVAIYLFKTRGISIHLPRRNWKKILILGSPLILSHIGGWVYGMIDKIMINNLINIESTGLYSIGYRFGMVVMMVETAFSLAWLPFFYENIAKNKYENNLKIVKATYIYLILLFMFAVFFGLIGKYLLFFMVDERFFGASKFILLISIAYFFAGVWKVFTGYLVSSGRMKTYASIIMFSALLHLFLSYLLIKYLGLIGAAWATCISMMAGAAVTILIATRVHDMPWVRKGLFREG